MVSFAECLQRAASKKLLIRDNEVVFSQSRYLSNLEREYNKQQPNFGLSELGVQKKKKIIYSSTSVLQRVSDQFCKCGDIFK